MVYIWDAYSNLDIIDSVGVKVNITYIICVIREWWMESRCIKVKIVDINQSRMMRNYLKILKKVKLVFLFSYSVSGTTGRGSVRNEFRFDRVTLLISNEEPLCTSMRSAICVYGDTISKRPVTLYVISSYLLRSFL